MHAPATALRWISALALTCAFSQPLLAQEAEPAPEEAAAAPAEEATYSGVEEITITATKRAQSVQDVPIAVTAITSEGLAARGIADVKDLQQVAPSLVATDSNSTTNGGVLRIRGVGTSGNNPGLESAVGTFIDGIYRSRAGLAMQDLIDVERVEVLRGPQGTLFGKNTSAGLVHVITKQPEFTWGGHVQGTVGNFDMRRLQASVTGPLIDETLAFRLAGSIHLRDGYYDDIDSDATFADRDRWALKGQFLFTPTESFDVRFIVDYTKMREHCCPAVQTTVGLNGVLLQGLGASFPGASVYPALNPENDEELSVGTNTDPKEDVDDWGLSAEANWDLDAMKLKGILAYRSTDIFRTQDIDFTNVDILRPGDTDETWENWSLEFQAGGTLESLLNLDWLIGWYGYSEDLVNTGEVKIATMTGTYIDQQVRRSITIPGYASRFPDGEGRESVHSQNADGWSIFTHNIFHPTDQFSFTIGARYGSERKEGSGIHNGAAPGQLSSAPYCDRSTTFPTNPLGNFLATSLAQSLRQSLTNTCDNFSWEGSSEKSNWSGTIQLGYAFTDDLNGYASVSRGYKAGGFNLDADAFNCEVVDAARVPQPVGTVLSGTAANGVWCMPKDLTKFDPEESLNYELGFKSQFFDGRLTANVALFWTDFSDFQLNTFTGLGFIINNIEQVLSRGVELEMTAFPWDGVISSFSVTYADTRYGDDIGNTCFQVQYPDLSVNRCPDYVPTGGLDTLPFPPGGTGNVFPSDQIADGHRIPQASAWTGSLSASIQKPLFSTGWFWYGGGNLYYRGRYKSSSDLDERKMEDAYIKLNVQAGFRSPDERFDVQAWVNNLTDEIVTTGYFDSVFQGGSISAFRQSPRTYGATATYHFGE
ncbi:MAG TPA: TonB-dependent receptor [Myxococcota bacterium]